tara:strand:- start:4484 stop:4756 length:273 start_codon:yes stop_codon:yes gene_type:complete
MTQFDDRVEKQRLKLEAEKWANGIKCLHAHQIKSMWYDDRPQDTDEGPVMDIQYNDGRIERRIQKTGEVVWMGEQIKGEDLIHAYTRGGI